MIVVFLLFIKIGPPWSDQISTTLSIEFNQLDSAVLKILPNIEIFNKALNYALSHCVLGDIKQGEAGDCWFLSSLCAFADCDNPDSEAIDDAPSSKARN